MGRNRFGIQFPDFEDMLTNLEKVGGDSKRVTEKALIESYNYVTPKLEADMRRHRRTGATVQSIDKTADVKWTGSIAEIKVGFRIGEGGLPSIFLMYGTPRMKPDRKLYNDIYGARTKKEIAELQEKIFVEEIRRLMGGR